MENSSGSIGSEKGGVITARGTGSGLIIRLDGRVDQDSLRTALGEFIDARRSFLTGNEVSLEWVGECPAEEFVSEISERLAKDFNINVKSSRLRDQVVISADETSAVEDAPLGESSKVVESFAGREVRMATTTTSRRLSPAVPKGPGPKGVSLFDGIEAIGYREEVPEFGGSRERKATSAAAEALAWDDPNARIIYATLRSGQKIETEHSLIVFGDVNSGAELIAGGDIIVLGSLRGVAHAGAYDETGGGRVIFAINLQPTQLRIGSVISRGGGGDSAASAELARVEGNIVVVEPYQARAVLTRKKS